ncbi:MAG: hypothetical protein ICV79_11880, partial [Flavisolibacter sp.]|nr:hypothetical protein [Flavisolibacter sp.]
MKKLILTITIIAFASVVSGCSKAQKITGDKKVLERLNYMINWLDSCQRRNGNGYVGGIPISAGRSCQT